MNDSWPELAYAEWIDTYETLHRYAQVVGKIKLALAPTLNEWWHVALHLWSRGITTGPIPFHDRLFEIRFDFLSHIVEMIDSVGNNRSIKLTAMPVAEFYRSVLSNLQAIGIPVSIDPRPQEIANPIPLDSDREHCSYDRQAIERYWRILSRIDGVFEQFRSGFSGKASPVHLWWGSFDLNVTRFCGRQCSPPPKSGRMARIDCDEEHFAAGFWFGDARLSQPAFYAYSYPPLPKLEESTLRPAPAHWNNDLREFILHYDDIRRLSNPANAILEFLNSSYDAIATLGKWDRPFLERTVK